MDNRSARCGDVWVNPHTNHETEAGAEGSVLRHYTCGSPEESIRKWGRIKDEQAIARALSAVDAVARATSARVFEMFWLDSTNYLAVVMTNDTEKGMAFVNPGHVDHYVKIDGSIELPKKPGIWRTYLPTSRSNGTPGTDAKVEQTTCECSPGVLISVYAQCERCEIRPVDRVENYAG